jgi:diguanylate cyclase (GGDEF)-like protein/PAS domain S-box-containing protein
MNTDFDAALVLCEIGLNTPGTQLLPAIANALTPLLQCSSIHIGANPPADYTDATPILHAGVSYGHLAVSGRYTIHTTPRDEAYQHQLSSLARLIGWLLHQRNTHDQRMRASQHTAERLKEQAQILDQIHESVITMDLAGYITGWNKGAAQLFGYSTDEALGKHILFLYADPDSDDDEGFQDAFLEHGGRELEVRRRRKSGEIFWASLQLSLMRNEAGQPCGLIGYLSDITLRIENEKNLRLQSRIFEHSEEGILITDANKQILSVNPAFCSMTGYALAEVLAQVPNCLNSDQHAPTFHPGLWERVEQEGSWHGEVWSRRKNGEDFPCWMSVNLVRNAEGRVNHYFSIFTDITERKQAEERIHYLAYYDNLTDLPNRSLFYKLVDQALMEAKRNHQHGAILFIDLNRFKPINDSLGHGIGDQLLKQVAERLRCAVRSEDVVARLGGDEFVIALFDITRREHAAIVAQKLLAALEPSFWVEQNELKIGAAIGISVYPRDGADTESLLRMADIAMYRAKKSDQDNYAFFSQEMNQRAIDRMKIESGLRHAIEYDELLLHYQPKVDLISGRIVGAEALVRWNHPERGMVSPAEFIPIAEESGLITQVSAWVLQAALQQAQIWQDAHLPLVRIAVNLSARDFSSDLSERVETLLLSYGVSADWLELEITEGMLTQSSDLVINMMDKLAALGVKLALDDFGTGYSSLSYLKRFPIDTLKIDRSFVTGIPDDGNDCAIAGAIISMAQRLGHRVIAEGVETQEQLLFLKSLGCQEIQGYLFSAPVPAAKFEQMIREDRRLPLHDLGGLQANSVNR